MQANVHTQKVNLEKTNQINPNRLTCIIFKFKDKNTERKSPPSLQRGTDESYTFLQNSCRQEANIHVRRNGQSEEANLEVGKNKPEHLQKQTPVDTDLFTSQIF